MNIAAERARQSTGRRKGALVDLAIWLGFIILMAVSAQWLAKSGGASELLLRIVAPVQMLALFAVATVLLRRRGETWRSLGLRPPVSAWRVVWLVPVGFFAVAAMNALLVLLILPKLGLPRPAFGALGALKGHPGTYAYWLIFALISAGIGEELQFRGFLWSRLERLFGGARGAGGLTLVAQAAIFGLGHIYQGLGGVLATAAAGLALGGVYLAGRRNLIACMVLHGMIDTISLTLLFLVNFPQS